LLIAPHSPLVARFARSQSGMWLPLASVQVRVALSTDRVTGLLSAATAIAVFPTYRPSDAFTAVLPLPKRS
jgi:hypothetical protein